MASVTVTFPDAVQQRVLDAFAATFGYDPASGVPKAAFAKQQLAHWVFGIVRDYEVSQAVAAAHNASATAEAKAATDITVS